MAARANLALNDGQSTPVSHTFNPTSGDGNIPGVSAIRYEDRSGGIKAGFPVIEIQTRAATRQNRNTKVTLLVKVPVLENVSNSTVSGIAPAPQAAYECIFRGEFVLPERSTEAVRDDVLAYAKNLLANAVVTSAISDLESPW